MRKTLLINGLIVVAAVVAGFALSMKPWQVYGEQKMLADDAVSRMKKSETKVRELVRTEASLRTSIGKEERARERGHLPKNEVAAPK